MSTEELSGLLTSERGEPKSTERSELLKNIKLIIRIRFLVSPSIFLLIFLAGLGGFTAQSAFSQDQLIVNGFNVAGILILNLTYALLLRRLEDLRPLVLLQLLIDIFHFTVTVYKTGGITSPFAFLYFFVIFSASILVSSRSAYLAAGVSVLSYALVLLLTRLGILSSQEFFSPLAGLSLNDSYIVLTAGFTVISFFAFAALSSYLTGLLHKRQQRLKRSHQVLASKHASMLLLYHVTQAINKYSTIREVVDQILSQLMDHMQLHRAILYLLRDGESLELYMIKRRGGDGGDLALSIPLREDAGLTARAAIRREAYNITNPEESPYINRELARKIGLNPFALAPMVVRERLVGIIGIDRSHDNGAILPDEFRLLQIFANQAAIALDSLHREGSFDDSLGKRAPFT
ncbi:MAG: GAF domain-containing protein [Alkalispirochaetaceae bacterium]